MNFNVGTTAPETVALNTAYTHSKCQRVDFSFPHAGKIAIVGGGPSLKMMWTELKGFDAVLAINATLPWLQLRGIPATFASIDTHPIIAKFAKFAERALVASRVAPETVDALKGYVRYFDAPGDVQLRTSTASTCLELAAKMGFRKIVLFGCESSYKGGQSHAYRHEDRDSIVVRADSRDYVTAPDFYLQAVEIADAIRANPGVISERSGGLLRAMIRDPKAEPIELRKAA